MNDKGMRKYLASQDLYDLADKKQNINDIMRYMLIRTQSMFEWHGLPDTIPPKYLEQYLQINGFAGITEVDGKLYAFEGGLGGEPDAYYNPTIFTVANPYLKFNKELRIDEECVIVRNDVFYMGLIPLLNKYASQLAENELSMYMASINTRVQSALSAGDDNTKESAQKYIDDLLKGKLSVISDNAFLQTLKSIPLTTSGATNVLGDLIEMEQYLKASLFNELGLNANYNMKREALNSAESSINDDILFPLVDELLKARQEGADAINAMYGTDISVELASSWSDNKAEEEAEINAIDGEAEADEEEPETSEEEAEESEEEAEESEEGAETSEEEQTEEADESTEETEEVTKETEEIKEDIEDIKKDIEDIKDEVTDEKEGDENEG